MKKPVLPTLLLLFAFLFSFVLCGFPTTVQVYKLLDRPGGKPVYSLTVTVQQSLYEYYASKSHVLASVSGFSKFITPYAVKPIADQLREIYSEDENFVNSVLTLVHQIPYSESDPKYPVEAIFENTGDCDVFSCLAASIILAGGLDAMLLYYEAKSHMNIAVSLAHTPRDAREAVHYVVYNNVKYYLAECTGENWINGWRVGECPPELEQPLKTAKIIALRNVEQTAPAQVSASYSAAQASTLTLNVSPAFTLQGAAVEVSGRLTPPLPNKQVTIYVKNFNSEWQLLGTTETNRSGEFLHLYTAEAAGVLHIRASWSGNGDYAGADSQIVNIIVLPQYLLMLLVAVAALALFGLALSLASKRTSLEELREPQLPEI